MKKQSQVEWLVKTLYNNGYLNQKPETSSVSGQNVLRIVNAAKESERQSHGRTWDIALDTGQARGWNIIRAYDDFEDYYDGKLNLKQMEDKLDEQLAKETTESLNEFIKSKRDLKTYNLGLNNGRKKAEQILYNEEEVREGIRRCFADTSASNLITIDDVIRYIKSLKQNNS
jgi:hypothetical protein